MALIALSVSCGAQAKGRGRRGDFSMVRIRLARFALPRLGLSGSKSGVSCSPLVCRVRRTIENVRASASRSEAVSIVLRGRAWEGKREDGEEDTRAACRRPHESVGVKGGGRHQEPDPFLKILHDAADEEGASRKNRSRKSDVAQAGVQASMSYCINRAVSISSDPSHRALNRRTDMVSYGN